MPDVTTETSPFACYPDGRYTVTTGSPEPFVSQSWVRVTVVCSDHGAIARLELEDRLQWLEWGGPDPVAMWAGFQAGIHEEREHSEQGPRLEQLRVQRPGGVTKNVTIDWGPEDA